jgi:hypothetical protein
VSPNNNKNITDLSHSEKLSKNKSSSTGGFLYISTTALSSNLEQSSSVFIAASLWAKVLEQLLLK